MSEVLLIDDGSPRPLHAPACDFPVRVIRQPRSGPAAARNLGARSACSPWLAFLDDDCVPDPGWLDEIATSISAEEAVAGVLRNALVNNKFAQASHILVHEFTLTQRLSNSSEFDFLPTANLAVRADTFWRIGGFNERFSLPAGEDRDFCHRWRSHGFRLRVVTRAFVDHYHDMHLPEFVRQHYRYGQGARLFYSLHRNARGAGRYFYARLVRSLGEQRHLSRTLTLGGLLAVSQASSAMGYLASAASEANDPHRRTA
jgi:GT2 family glycosyltransferase